MFNVASPRKSERLISSRGHGCFTITPPQLPATATRLPSHGSGRPGLELRTVTKLSSMGFEHKAVLTFGLRVRRLNHSATHALCQDLSPLPLLHFIFSFSLSSYLFRIGKFAQWGNLLHPNFLRGCICVTKQCFYCFLLLFYKNFAAGTAAEI